MRVLFDGYCLDSDRRELRVGDTLVPTQPQVFDLLEYLIANRDRVISKDDLISSIWKGRIVSDSTLLSRINAARRAIGDDGGQQRLIRTVARKGVRFVGTVQIPLAEESPARKLPDKPSIAVLPFQNMTGDPDQEYFADLPLPNKPSIAVLPFHNIGDNPEQEYFADGIVEDIITELSRFRSLFVVARNSSFSYKGKAPDLRQVGKELGVRYVLEGSIRKATDRIRVTGQLTDTSTGNHVWAERYDRVLEDVFAVQEEITLAIVGAIAPQIDSMEQSKAKRRRPENLSAYEIAVRAWAHAVEGFDKTDRKVLDLAIREAKEALTIDPGSVLALHALARASGDALLFRLAVDREQVLGEAMAAIGRAIELDGADPRSYALRALITYHGGQIDRYADALADALRARDMNPADTYVLSILSAVEAVVGEPESAIEHAHQFFRLSPGMPRKYGMYTTLAIASFSARRYAEGVRWASRALNDMPQYASPHLYLTTCLVGTGEIEKAKAAFSAGQALAPEYFRIRAEGASVYARAEDRKRQVTFVRIAAGLEDPKTAEAMR